MIFLRQGPHIKEDSVFKMKTEIGDGIQDPKASFSWVIYEGHFRSNITVQVTSLCMIQF